MPQKVFLTGFLMFILSLWLRDLFENQNPNAVRMYEYFNAITGVSGFVLMIIAVFWWIWA